MTRAHKWAFRAQAIGRAQCVKISSRLVSRLAIYLSYEHQRSDRNNYVTLKSKFSYLKHHDDYRVRTNDEERIIDSYRA